MNNGTFVTMIGGNYFKQSRNVIVDDVVLIVKDIENKYDDEAIAVLMRGIGQVGYVANSTHTVARGTRSAGRIYDTFKTFNYVIVRFILKDCAIIELLDYNEILFGMEDFKLEIDFLSKKQ